MYRNYGNPDSGIMDQWFPREHAAAGENFYYWWQAHVLDVLVDAYKRTGKPVYADRMEAFSRSLYKYNGHTFTHNYYDDMEWTALALLRAHQATGSEWYKERGACAVGRHQDRLERSLRGRHGVEEGSAGLQKHAG